MLLPDPALSTGYGQDFIQRGWGAWGEAPYTDLMDVTDAVVARDDDHRVVEKALVLQAVQDGAQITIHVGDLAVVGAAGEVLPEGRRRIIG